MAISGEKQHHHYLLYILHTKNQGILIFGAPKKDLRPLGEQTDSSGEDVAVALMDTQGAWDARMSKAGELV